MIAVATPPGVRAAFTTREGGVSTGPRAGLNLGGAQGDDAAAVRRNRAMLCARLGVAPERVHVGTQVHGALVRRVAGPPADAAFTRDLAGWPEGDALVTDAPGVPLVVLGADCLPVLAWRTDGSAVGAAHAGWRGLVAGVVEALVEALGPGETAAAIGPGIGPCCYTTGDEVRERFLTRFGPATVAGDGVDLAAAAAAALRAAGVAPGGVTRVAACTSCEPERFFSHRRDAGVTGRQGGVVWRDAGILAG